MGKKEKKKSQVPEDTVESVLADSMCIASAVAAPSMVQLSKNSRTEQQDFDQDQADEDITTQSPSSLSEPLSEPLSGGIFSESKDFTNIYHLPPLSNSVDRSSPVKIVRQLTRQNAEMADSEVDSSRSQEDSIEISGSSSFERVEKSPLRSILKKSASTHSHASSTDVSEYLPADEISETNEHLTNGDSDDEDNDIPIIVSCCQVKSVLLSLWLPVRLSVQYPGHLNHVMTMPRSVRRLPVHQKVTKR